MIKLESRIQNPASGCELAAYLVYHPSSSHLRDSLGAKQNIVCEWCMSSVSVSSIQSRSTMIYVCTMYKSIRTYCEWLRHPAQFFLGGKHPILLLDCNHPFKVQEFFHSPGLRLHITGSRLDQPTLPMKCLAGPGK